MASEEVWLRIRGEWYPPRGTAGSDTQAQGTAADGAGRSVQEASEPVVTVQEVKATCYYKAGAYYIFYEEQPEGQEQPLKVRIKRRERLMEIHRQGEMGSRMVFEPGKSYRTDYATPFGSLPLDIETHSVELLTAESLEERESWQDVKIRYRLSNQGEALGEYELSIEKM